MLRFACSSKLLVVMWDFIIWAAMLGLLYLIWDCIEVGRNDAANLVNAVFGARLMKRRTAVLIAGVAVIVGASFSAPVMETARKGIFDPTVLTIQMALAIYVSVYFVDTILLYGFSGFGMPVSTTACLVFELVGAALFVAGYDNVAWPKVGKVATGIVCSIAISGVGSFLIMRVFRGAIRDGDKDRETVLLHGPWIAGALLTFLTWFMVFKGLKNVELIKELKTVVVEYGEWSILAGLWCVYTFLLHISLVITHRSGYKYLFPGTAVLGMVCMAFAFGQNDLANAASPGLSGLALWQSGTGLEGSADIGSKIEIKVWALFGCGVLMALGMFSSYAQRVTRAAVNTGSQYDHVALYAPEWCKSMARFIMRLRGNMKVLAPAPKLTEIGKKIHFDTLRASVITAVSASVIAFASGHGLPVSTTYVAFAAIIGTGLSDRVFSRGDADVKMGRAIWVVTCWFIAPVIAVVITGCVALIVYHLTIGGLFVCIGVNVAARLYFKRRSDRHERQFHVDPAEVEAAAAD